MGRVGADEARGVARRLSATRAVAFSAALVSVASAQAATANGGAASARETIEAEWRKNPRGVVVQVAAAWCANCAKKPYTDEWRRFGRETRAKRGPTWILVDEGGPGRTSEPKLEGAFRVRWEGQDGPHLKVSVGGREVAEALAGRSYALPIAARFDSRGDLRLRKKGESLKAFFDHALKTRKAHRIRVDDIHVSRKDRKGVEKLPAGGLSQAQMVVLLSEGLKSANLDHMVHVEAWDLKGVNDQQIKNSRPVYGPDQKCTTYPPADMLLRPVVHVEGTASRLSAPFLQLGITELIDDKEPGRCVCGDPGTNTELPLSPSKIGLAMLRSSVAALVSKCFKQQRRELRWPSNPLQVSKEFCEIDKVSVKSMDGYKVTVARKDGGGFAVRNNAGLHKKFSLNGARSLAVHPAGTYTFTASAAGRVSITKEEPLTYGLLNRLTFDRLKVDSADVEFGSRPYGCSILVERLKQTPDGKLWLDVNRMPEVGGSRFGPEEDGRLRSGRKWKSGWYRVTVGGGRCCEKRHERFKVDPESNRGSNSLVVPSRGAAAPAKPGARVGITVRDSVSGRDILPTRVVPDAPHNDPLRPGADGLYEVPACAKELTVGRRDYTESKVQLPESAGYGGKPLQVEATLVPNPTVPVTMPGASGLSHGEHKFEIGRTEVTQAEWMRLSAGRNPSRNRRCKRCPVENMTFWSALSYCNALSARHKLPACYELKGCSSDRHWGQRGYVCRSARFRGAQCAGFRLPLQSEWLAALGEWGGAPPTKEARQRVEDAAQHKTGKRALPPREVGWKDANMHGLMDMVGNVWEWIWDASGGGEGSGTKRGTESAVPGASRLILGCSVNGSWRGCWVPSGWTSDRLPGQGGEYLGLRVTRTLRGGATPVKYASAVQQISKSARRAWGVGVGAVGLVAAGLGGVGFVLSRREGDKLESMTAAESISGITRDEALARSEQIERELWVRGSVLGAGVGLLAVGAWLIASSDGDSARVSVRVKRASLSVALKF